MKQSFNPCDECDYSYSKNNQESRMCNICEFAKQSPFFPMKIGDTVYVDSKTLPIEKMDFEEVKDEPLYFAARVVSFRINSKGKFVKLAVKAEWYYEWFDPEVGPDGYYCNVDKYFTYPLSALGKTVFVTEEEAKQRLEDSQNENKEN